MRISDWSSDVCSSDLQKVALERAIHALDTLRPGASDDMTEAMKRNPELLREAAAGRSGPMIEAMAREARVCVEPALRADRFVERRQGFSADRDRPYRAGDVSGRERQEEHTADLQTPMR